MTCLYCKNGDCYVSLLTDYKSKGSLNYNKHKLRENTHQNSIYNISEIHTMRSEKNKIHCYQNTPIFSPVNIYYTRNM